MPPRCNICGQHYTMSHMGNYIHQCNDPISGTMVTSDVPVNSGPGYTPLCIYCDSEIFIDGNTWKHINSHGMWCSGRGARDARRATPPAANPIIIYCEYCDRPITQGSTSIWVHIGGVNGGSSYCDNTPVSSIATPTRARSADLVIQPTFSGRILCLNCNLEVEQINTTWIHSYSSSNYCQTGNRDLRARPNFSPSSPTTPIEFSTCRNCSATIYQEGLGWVHSSSGGRSCHDSILSTIAEPLIVQDTEISRPTETILLALARLAVDLPDRQQDVIDIAEQFEEESDEPGLTEATLVIARLMEEYKNPDVHKTSRRIKSSTLDK